MSQDGSAGSVVGGVGGSETPAPGRPLRGTLSSNPHSTPPQVLLLSNGARKDFLAGLVVVCRHPSIASLPYNVPASVRLKVHVCWELRSSVTIITAGP